MITAEVATSEGMVAISGTVLRGESHIVRVNEFWIDFVPTTGHFLFVDHKDRPGLIGSVGNITGSVDVNISAMYVSRVQSRGKALMILDLDEQLPEEARQKILAIPDVYTAKKVLF
jgi:D-3-phosphoglycerate dehydrogenase